MKRRTFIKNSIRASALLTIPVSLSGCVKSKIRFGLIADVHKDVMHDGDARLQAFIDEVQKRDLDFIMQLGDFCRPYDYNQSFMDVWNQYRGTKHHVLGNHDMDGGFTREQTMAFWRMKSKYYSFDQGGLHFIILDGNDPNPKPWSGYNRYIDSDQLEWLKQDLENTKFPTIIMSHQTLENPDGGVANQKEVRQVLEDANRQSRYQKVLACISGHHHTDYLTEINGIYYLQVNSASYYWVGGDHQVIRYSDKIDEEYPWIKYTIPYEDSLFTFIEIHPSGKLTVEGKSTKFVGPGPKELGLPPRPENDPIVPYITAREVKLSKVVP